MNAVVVLLFLLVASSGRPTALVSGDDDIGDYGSRRSNDFYTRRMFLELPGIDPGLCSCNPSPPPPVVRCVLRSASAAGVLSPTVTHSFQRTPASVNAEYV